MNYLSLLTSFCRGLPRFSALVSAVLSQVDDLISCVNSILPSFSLNDAVGNQLEFLGFSLGIERPVGSSDADYLLLINMKLARWRWDGANDTIIDIISQIDDGGIEADNCNGTVTVTPSESFSGDVSKVYPVPAGVGLTM